MNSFLVCGPDPTKKMLAPSNRLVQNRRSPLPPPSSPPACYAASISGWCPCRGSGRRRFPSIAAAPSFRASIFSTPVKTGTGGPVAEMGVGDVDVFVEVGNKLADAAGEIIRKYFRKSFEIVDKDDLSGSCDDCRPGSGGIDDLHHLAAFPSHAIYGEENGWRCREIYAEYVWVLDPIDGTKSFITGKPLFGTLIALLHKGEPIVGIIDQPVLRERWIGVKGRKTTLNGSVVSARSCSSIAQAYLYTTSPHLFSSDAEEAFIRVRDKVKVPLYGCDCYAYALLATGFVDLVVESGLKPYDFLSLIPVIEGAGGLITDWRGQDLHWEASPESNPECFKVVAAGDPQLHQQALDLLQWE